MYILLLILFVLLLALTLNKVMIYKEKFITNTEIQEEYRIFSSNEENLKKLNKFFELLEFRDGSYYIDGEKISCSNSEDIIEENIII